MQRFSAANRLLASVVLCIAGTFGQSILAGDRPTAPHLVPDTTLAMVRFTDTRDFREKFGESAMGRMLKDEKVRPLAQSLYGLAAQTFARIEDRVGLPLDKLLSVPQGEVCIAVLPGEGGPPQ